MSSILNEPNSSTKTINEDEIAKYDQEEIVLWEHDRRHPRNWKGTKKAYHVFAIATVALVASLGTSIITPARSELIRDYGANKTTAILPLSLFVFALALGPVIGGPLSEMVGRYPVTLASVPLGIAFTIGAALVKSLAGICVFRFLAGLSFAPCMAIGPAMLADMFETRERTRPGALFVMMPTTAPGFGPIIGSYVFVGKGYAWTQWTLIFFAAFSLALQAFSSETHATILKRRIDRAQDLATETTNHKRPTLRDFLTVSLFRPIHMLFTEPITAFIALHTACSFAILFSFFAGFPYVFIKNYNFTTEQQGLVFASIIVGNLIALPTILILDVKVYQPRAKHFPSDRIPPELRLHGALIGSIGLPAALFWFAWTANASVHWASPCMAMVVFAWANLCVFMSTAGYLIDTYGPMIAASAMAANVLARYGLAAVFPLFSLQMFQSLGVGWAVSTLGFVTLALLPLPWILFKFGPKIRAMSSYETVKS